MAKRNGHVCILCNPANPGTVQINKTTKSPKEYLTELSGKTGIKYELAHSVHVSEARKVERFVHQALEDFRVGTSEQKLFSLPVSQAIEILALQSINYLI